MSNKVIQIDLSEIPLPTKRAATFGTWHADLNGDLSCQSRDYVISSNELTGTNWTQHLLGKKWINFNDFIPAYYQALVNANVKKITLDIYHN